MSGSHIPAKRPPDIPGGSPDGQVKVKKKYVRAVGPKLKVLLWVIFALAALMGANSAYLVSVTVLDFVHRDDGVSYQNWFYLYMFLAHLVLGLLLIGPFFVFSAIHMWNTRGRKNRRAVRVGYALFAAVTVLIVSGVVLVRIEGLFELKDQAARLVVYWMHALAPLAVLWLYWLHRLAGPKIKWKVGFAYMGLVGAAVAVMLLLHSQDPRKWNVVGPADGEKYFQPSEAITATGGFIDAKAMMNDQYCQKCHADVHAGWADSVHRSSSFNNPPYLASVSETREVALKRDGSVKASRWCAGCHDPVPFFSGAFDDPNYDLINHPTAHAGITCTVCHSITHVNSTRGNADYTIEEAAHYPFAYSENKVLQWVNNQLIKAKPDFHKRTFLKPLHKSGEFCSTCHKVSLPKELNHYKEFLRGQNHWDNFLLSGVSGHGARSFYYPPESKENCNDCHMPLVASRDFGAKHFNGAKELSIHDHLYPSANTGLAWLRDRPKVLEAHQKFRQGALRVDIFALREGGEIDGRLLAPLRPEVPKLSPGKKYLLDTVIRTLKLGHIFTQGTADSNEVWLDVTVTSGLDSNGDPRVIGRSGGLDPAKGKEVDPYSHFVNVFMLDREGRRIDRRNPQDIFTPLYNNQIPPGAGQTVHYELQLPEQLSAPVTVEVKLQYRKFDQRYMDFVAKKNAQLGNKIRGYEPGKPYVNELPISTLAVDKVTFPVEGVEATVENPAVDFPLWQRWNDYGIGLLLKGKAELRQAEQAFTEVEKLNRWDGPLNLARVLNVEGRLDEATAALNRAAAYQKEEGFPRWTWAWLSGWINLQQGRFEDAEKNLRAVLYDRTPEMQARKLDFSLDYEVLNLLGQALFDVGNLRQRQGRKEEARQKWLEAVEHFEKTLSIDTENVTAHHNLKLLYEQLGDKEKAAEHEKLHVRYKPDDNAQGRAVRLARERYPAANLAAEAVVKYNLRRPGAPELPPEAAATPLSPATAVGAGAPSADSPTGAD